MLCLEVGELFCSGMVVLHLTIFWIVLTCRNNWKWTTTCTFWTWFLMHYRQNNTHCTWTFKVLGFNKLWGISILLGDWLYSVIKKFSPWVEKSEPSFHLYHLLDKWPRKNCLSSLNTFYVWCRCNNHCKVYFL